MMPHHQVIGLSVVSQVEASVPCEASVPRDATEFLGGSHFGGQKTTRLELVSLGDTDGCTPTPPARRGRGILRSGDFPDEQVGSSLVVGGGTGAR